MKAKTTRARLPIRASTRAALALAASLAPLLLAGAPAAAQTDPGQERPARLDENPRTPGGVVLAERPLLLRSLGFRIRLPIGAAYETTTVSGTEAAFTMTAADKTWRMTLHSPTSRDESLSVADVADHLLAEIRRARAVRNPQTGQTIDSATEVIDRSDDLEINDQPASRFYIAVPSAQGEFTVISGYTVFRVAPGRFAVLQMDTLPPEYERARAAYETVVATAEFRDPVEMAAERAAGVKSGEGFLQSVTREQIERHLPSVAWFRLYRPARTGRSADAEEVGYQRIEMKVGHRGDLNPARPKSRWGAADKEPGYVVRVTGRILDDGRTIDSDSVFFLSFDRAQEAWAVRMAIRANEETFGWTETGVRDAGELEVIIDQPAQTPVTKQWRTPPEGYLSQVGAYLLPRLLVDRGAPGVLNFYRYQTRAGEITLRRDDFALFDPQSQDLWILRTRASEDAAEDTTLLDADGRIVRRELASGVIMKPIGLDELKSLWTGKGLPLN